MSVVGGGDGIGVVIDACDAGVGEVVVVMDGMDVSCVAANVVEGVFEVDVSDSLVTDVIELTEIDRDIEVLSEVNAPVLHFMKF